MRKRILLATSMIVTACSGSDSAPEEVLRAWVDEMEHAAEDMDRSAMLDRISANYVDARGNSRKDIGETLFVYFLRQQNIVLVSTIDEITISDDSVAELVLTVGMAGTNDSALGLSADAYRFELELEKSNTEWLLIGARWGELGHELR